MAKKNKIVVGKKNKKRSNAAGASKKVSRPAVKNQQWKKVSSEKQEKSSEMPHDDMQLFIPLRCRSGVQQGHSLWCLGMTPSDSLGTCLVVSASFPAPPAIWNTKLSPAAESARGVTW